jgi:hypothetical protein
MTDNIANMNIRFIPASSRELVLYNIPSIRKSPSINSSHGRYTAKNLSAVLGNISNALSEIRNPAGSEIFASPAIRKIQPNKILKTNDMYQDIFDCLIVI